MLAFFAEIFPQFSSKLRGYTKFNAFHTQLCNNNEETTSLWDNGCNEIL